MQVAWCFLLTLSQPTSAITTQDLIHAEVTSHGVKSIMRSGSAPAPSKGIFPVYYLHIPKAGGNFVTTVAHTACQGALSPDKAYKTSCCAKDLPITCRKKVVGWDGTHYPVVPSLDILPKPGYPHVVAMFRDPRQRLISGFYHNRHDCEQARLSEAPKCENEDDFVTDACLPLREAATPEKLQSYAECVANCSARLVATAQGDGENGCAPLNSTGEPHALFTENQLKKALEHITKDYGFVGLADHYELSVCLWHARFGSPCLPVEFSNMRPGVRHKDSMYDESVVSDEVDALLGGEQLVYSAARKRFYKDLKTYGVNRSTCKRLCPEPASVWEIDNTAFEGLSASLLRGSADMDMDKLAYDWPGRLAFDID